MTGRRTLLALLVLFGLPVAGEAEVRTGALTLTPMAGYQWFDGDLDLQDSAVYGLALGYNASPNWALELDVRYAPAEADFSGGPDVDAYTVTGNVLYHFQPERAFVPYLVGGLGGLQYDIDHTGHDDEDFVVNFGGGFKYAVAENVDLRVDLRDTVDFRTDNRGDSDGNDTANNVAATFGLTFQFGGYSQRPVSLVQAVRPVAKAPAAAVPSAAAAIFPAVAPVVNTEVAAGDDRDGVAEPVDRCPGTPPGVRVDASGCPADTDRDGVADYLDACVGTRTGVNVDARGCAQPQQGRNSLPLQITFGAGKSEVNPFHYRELDRAAAFIRQHPNTQVLVEVPADAQGLAQARAENLRRMLITRYALPAGQIVAQGDSLGGRGVMVSVIP